MGSGSIFKITVCWAVVFLIMVFGQLEAFADTSIDSMGDCMPPCEAGLLCYQNRCIELCNPPCMNGERCDQNGECVSAKENSAAVTPIEYSVWSGFHIREKRVGSRADKLKLKNLLETCPAAMQEYKAGNAIAIPGYLFINLGLMLNTFAIVGSSSRTFNGSYFALSFGSMALAFPFVLGSTVKHRKATEMYNSQNCALSSDATCKWLSVSAAENVLNLEF